MSAALQRTVIVINLKFDFRMWISTAIDSSESEPINMHNNKKNVIPVSSPLTGLHLHLSVVLGN